MRAGSFHAPGPLKKRVACASVIVSRFRDYRSMTIFLVELKPFVSIL